MALIVFYPWIPATFTLPTYQILHQLLFPHGRERRCSYSGNAVALCSMHNFTRFESSRGFEGNLKINKFRVDGSVRSADAMQILKAFLSNEAVATTLEVDRTGIQLR